MKVVMLSVQPNPCEQIANRKKFLEIRKTKPKLKPPFKCLIYCTNTKYHHLYDLTKYNHGQPLYSVTQHNKYSLVPKNYLNGKVIGEFVCNNIDEIVPDYNPITKKFLYGNEVDTAPTCLSEKQLQYYGQGKPLYFWHISELKIYDTPKELSEFKRECDGNCKIGNKMCVKVKDRRLDVWANCDSLLPLIRPPQSWCYVEVEE